MAFLSLGVGFIFIYILTKSLLESLIILPFFLIFHNIFKPDWRKFFQILFHVIMNIPKAVFEGFEVLLLKNEKIETLECKPNDRIVKIISITLTPKSAVVMMDKETLYVHRMVKK